MSKNSQPPPTLNPLITNRGCHNRMASLVPAGKHCFFETWNNFPLVLIAGPEHLAVKHAMTYRHNLRTNVHMTHIYDLRTNVHMTRELTYTCSCVVLPHGVLRMRWGRTTHRAPRGQNTPYQISGSVRPSCPKSACLEWLQVTLSCCTSTFLVVLVSAISSCLSQASKAGPTYTYNSN